MKPKIEIETENFDKILPRFDSVEDVGTEAIVYTKFLKLHNVNVIVCRWT